MNEESKKPRLIFLDNIKILFAILVIFTHVRVTYGGEGWWYYIESNPVDIGTAIFFYMSAGFAGIFQASLLGLFFLMGAYFTPKSYDRKGFVAFWKERVIRLGVPVLLYTFLINPILFYLLNAGGFQPMIFDPRFQTNSFMAYYLSFLTVFTITWYLVVLLIFTAIYTIWCQIAKINWIQQRIPKELNIPKYIYLLLLAIGLGILSFLVRLVFSIIDTEVLPFAYMIQYFMMFSVGIIAYRYGWFEKMTRHQVKLWAITIFVVVFLFFTYFFVIFGVDADFSVFFGGFNINSLIFALVDNIACMGMIFVLIKIFYAKFNKQGKILQNLADSSFHMYLIHPFVVIPVSLGFSLIPLSPIIKLFIVLPVSVILCYLISHFILQKIHLNKNSRITHKITEKSYSE
jgi:hypothetical protein